MTAIRVAKASISVLLILECLNTFGGGCFELIALLCFSVKRLVGRHVNECRGDGTHGRRCA